MTKTKERMLTEALMKAREEIHLSTSGKNSHQGWKYATIEDIEEAISGPLKKNRCHAWHERFIEQGAQCMRTVIEHIDTGERIEDVCFIESEKPGNQGKGSALTYMRKDAFRCLLRLTTSDDDDQAEQDYIKKTNEQKASEYHVNQLRQLINKTSAPARYLTNVLSFNKVSTLEELGEQQCERALRRIKEIVDQS